VLAATHRPRGSCPPSPATSQVLTTGSWPTQAASKCVLPPALEACCREFSAFYLERHSGRKLAWQTNMGTVDLRAEFGGEITTAGAAHQLLGNAFE
jgi:cullin 3